MSKSKPLWTSAAIEAATGGRATAPFAATGLSIDTRTLQPGDLFIALKDVRDGHDFVPAAFAAGASGALVSRPVEGAGGPLLLADDVLGALERLGVAARERAPGCTRIAVTGSVGKTSVKEMIARIQRAAGPAHWSVKSFNNHWGVPLTLARMPQETRRAVFEIGMNTPGEIAPRSRMVAPHVGVITRIAPAHLQGLGSIEGVAREKSDIVAGLLPGGAVCLPLGDPQLPFLAARVRALQPRADIHVFGWREDLPKARDIRGVAGYSLIEAYATDGRYSHVALTTMTCQIEVEIEAVGRHWADNVACALLASRLNTDGDLYEAALALSGYTPPPGRGTAETLMLPEGREITLVDDAYNANPASMRAALAGFAARPCRGKRVLALGEMLEIGAGSREEHAALAGAVVQSGARIVLAAGEGMKALIEALPRTIRAHHAVKAEELNETLKNLLEDGDLLLLKGSNASGMGRLAEHLRQYSKGASEAVMGAARTAVKGKHAV